MSWPRLPRDRAPHPASRRRAPPMPSRDHRHRSDARMHSRRRHRCFGTRSSPFRSRGRGKRSPCGSRRSTARARRFRRGPRNARHAAPASPRPSSTTRHRTPRRHQDYPAPRRGGVRAPPGPMRRLSGTSPRDRRPATGDRQRSHGCAASCYCTGTRRCR